MSHTVSGDCWNYSYWDLRTIELSCKCEIICRASVMNSCIIVITCKYCTITLSFANIKLSAVVTTKL